MRRYAGHSGETGVVAYEDVEDGIAVQFHGGKVYLYSVASVGARHLARMRAAAVAGRGLSTYISREVHDRYAEVFDSATAWRQRGT